MPILSNDMIIAIVIAHAKVIQSKLNIAILQAFEEEIHNSFFFVGRNVNWKQGEGAMCEYSEYVKMFHSAIMGESELNPLYCWGITKYYGYKPVPLDEAAIEELRLKITEKRDYINEATRRTAQMRRMLGNTPIGAASKNLPPLLEWQKVNQEMDLYFYIDIFNLGYIEGKRAERARKHQQKNKERKGTSECLKQIVTNL